MTDLQSRDLGCKTGGYKRKHRIFLLLFQATLSFSFLLFAVTVAVKRGHVSAELQSLTSFLLGWTLTVQSQWCIGPHLVC